MCGGSIHGKRTLSRGVYGMCGGSRHGKRTLSILVYVIPGGSRYEKRALVSRDECSTIIVH